MKKIILLFIILISFSCQKRYDCVCESVSKKRDTLITTVHTTKIGVSGFEKDCEKNESLLADFKNCRIE
ncbi:hypothetical protein CNR22_01065 [Sphingobacteriaceae bacterium]|nr:hypothetical protein CNR22_01065 [Sphingobacteriaceae bacterium]